MLALFTVGLGHGAQLTSTYFTAAGLLPGLSESEGSAAVGVKGQCSRQAGVCYCPGDAGDGIGGELDEIVGVEAPNMTAYTHTINGTPTMNLRHFVEETGQ